MKKINIKAFILWGILIMFLLGGLFHFVYDITGNQFVLGLLFPVNESIFEHIKIAALPVLIYWSIGYYIKKEEINANVWFTSALISMLIASLLVPMFYYFYTETFGIENMIVDISLLLIGFAISQTIALHYYNHGKGINAKLAVVIMIAVIVLFGFWTVSPPELPIFKEASSGTYGIFSETF
ncbi:MAG: DUF6512 family protein [Clostridia bacterium]